MPDSSMQRGLSRIHRWGMTSWSALGIILLLVVITMGLGAIRSVVVPFVIAFILAAVTEPLVLALERRKVQHLLATVISMLFAVGLAVAIVWMVGRGFIHQLPLIQQQLLAGWDAFLSWGRSLDLDPAVLDRIRTSADHYVSKLSSGLVGIVSATFSGALAFVMGTFFAGFFLFFMLRDNRLFPKWLARVTNSDEDLFADIMGVTNEALRGYFKGTAVTALLTAPIFMVPWIVLDIPSAIAIFVLYFVLSFVPYVGAWVTGAIAVLIAFGSGGTSAALIILLAFLISNGAIQNAVASWALGSSLKIHPVTVMLATLIGGAIAGLIGMILAAPMVAALSRSLVVVREHKAGLAEPTGQSATEK
jgi:predicted PurR-regulated permease PerM